MVQNTSDIIYSVIEYRQVEMFLKGGGHGHFQDAFLVSIVSLGGAEIKYHV